MMNSEARKRAAITSAHVPTTADVKAAYCVAGMFTGNYATAYLAGLERFGPEFDAWLAGIAASNPTAPRPAGTLEGAPGADSEALAARTDLADLLASWCSKSGHNMGHLLCGELVHRQHYEEADLILASSWLADHDRQTVREHVTAALDEIERRIDAWVRHGEAVPADVTTYDRAIVHTELRDLVRGHRQEQDR